MATIAVAAALSLGGCSAGSVVSPTDSSSGGGISEGRDAAVDGGVEPGEVKPDEGAPSVSEQSTSDADREVIKTGYMSITVDDPFDAAAEATRITTSVGGRVDSRTEYAATTGNKGSAVLTLRLPVDSLDATLDKLRALGTVQELNLSTTDVTTEAQDLDARIRALSASLDRLIGLLSTATDTDTLIKLESAISERQGQLESLESQRRYLTDQVSLSTITVTFGSVEDAPAVTPDTFWSGIVTGWAALVAFFSGLVVLLGVLTPWLVLLGILTAVTIVLIRRRSRRSPAVPAPADTPARADTAAPADAAAPAPADTADTN